VTSFPRAPVLASSEVASHAVEYARGPLRGSVFLFAVLSFIFAVVAYTWGEWIWVVLLTLFGILFVCVGLWIQFTRPGRASDGIRGTDEPTEAGTHEPD
jgi:hypothetical protein